MHYTGMAAVTFTPSEMMHDDLSHAISVSSLGVTAIGLGTFVVLGAVLLSNLRFDSLPTARQLIARYFLSLGLISVLAILGMLLVEHQGGETRVEARTINIAGRQRTLSQAMGHVEGDRALVEAAGLLSRCVRQSDIVARFGGDEFVLLLTIAEKDWENSILHRLQQQLDASNAQPGRRYGLSFSVGVVTAEPERWLTLEDLVAEADAVMYRQKQRKKSPA
jgi:hypothetical protein